MKTKLHNPDEAVFRPKSSSARDSGFPVSPWLCLRLRR